MVQVSVWYNYQISPFGSYSNFKYSGKWFSISNSRPFKLLGVIADGERCSSEIMFDCNCTYSTKEFACQTVLPIGCIIEYNYKYNCSHCPTWSTSFSNACVILPSYTLKFARPSFILFKTCLFFDISTLGILITKICSSAAWAIFSWLLANLLTLEGVVFRSNSVAVQINS